MGDYCYAEYVLGSVKNRNKVICISDIESDEERTDCYKSVFLFDSDLKYYVDKTGSVKGFAGKHISDALVFDFDGEDLEAVKNEVIRFCEYLHHNLDAPYEILRVSFSGSKGFHVEIPFVAITDAITPLNDFWEVYKCIAMDLVADFNFVDKSIYEIRRIFRMLNTINSKSGLYKIPLTRNELVTLSISEIQSLAKSQRVSEYMPDEEITSVTSLNEIYEKWCNSQSKKKEQNTTSHYKPESKRDELLEVILHGVPNGNRHGAMVSIIGMFLDKGFDYDFIYSILELWNEKNDPPLPIERLSQESLNAFNSYKREEVIIKPDVTLYNIHDACKVYAKQSQEDEGQKVKTGFTLIDKKLRGISRGETCCILGKTSVGKSAVLQNIGMNYAIESGAPVLFFSLEMPITSVFERALQIVTGLSGKEIEESFGNNEENILRSSEMLFTKIPNFHVITESNINLTTMQQTIRYCEEYIYKQKTGLVLVDYLGLVNGKGADIYQQVSKVARGMKDMAKETDTPIIFLSQVNRKFEDSSELTLGAARDSGAIDEASDFILGLWKEDGRKSNTKQREQILNLGILKNRKGGLGNIKIVMDKKSLRISELVEESNTA